MNKNCIKTIFSIWLIALMSCTNDVDEIFDVSASQRLDQQLEDYRELLINASNGWHIIYYPETDKYGGYNMFIKFDPNQMATVLVEGDAEPTQGMYSLKGDTGPTLNFDTFISSLHQFSDPSQDGYGMEGDYEFILLNHTDNEITLKGKKRGIELVMHRVGDHDNWNEMIGNIALIADKAVAMKYQMNWNGEILPIRHDNRYFMMLTETENGSEWQNIPYAFTLNGISFYKPFEYKGISVQDFKFNENEEKSALICTSNNNIVIEFIIPPVNELVCSSTKEWYFDPSTMGTQSLTILNSIKENSVKIGEQLYFLAIVPGNGILKTSSFAVMLASFDGKSVYGGYLGLNIIATPDTENQVTITFTGEAGANGAWYFNNVPGYMDLIKSLIANPYEVSMDDLKNPTTITYKRIDNAEYSFTLTTKEVIFP